MKRNSKRILALSLALALALSVAGCQKKDPAPEESGIYTPGTYTSEAQGYGGTVTVEITVDANAITDVKVTGDQETPSVGGAHLEELADQVKEKGAEIDGVSGATVTSKAVKAAAADCIAKAKGETGETTGVKMAPGKYTGYAESFHAHDGITVEIEVSETELKSITVDQVNTSDMSTILQSAVDLLIPRMLEYQSVTIDAITGATTSSNAIKMATENALVEALKAGGSDESAIRSFYVTMPKKGGQETLDTEVLVIGMGGSGTATALSASEQGLKVLAIDKAGKYGGTSSLTMSGLFVNPTRYQAEHNEGKDYVDADALYQDWLDYCMGDAKEELVSKMVYESGEVMDWLVYDHNVMFCPPARSFFADRGNFAVCADWYPNDRWNNKDVLQGYFDSMWKEVTDNGGSYLLETEGYALITDENGNVTGAKARNLVDGTEYTINAKAVVIATGGYAGSAELQEEFISNEYYPLKGVWCHYGSKQNDGKMLKAAIDDAGAGTYNIGMPPEVHTCGTVTTLTGQFEPHYLEGQVGMVSARPAYWTAGDLPENMGWNAASLAVDKNGERFTNEELVSFLNPWIAGPRYYSVWSTEQIEKLKTEGFKSNNGSIFVGSGTPIPVNTPIPNVDEVLKAAEEAGILVKADTIEELATKMGMDPATLKNTVDAYNGYCETGVDEQFHKSAENLDKIGEGPYYGITMAAYMYGTCGGLDINEHMEVLKTDGETVIEGLYAVGTDSMGTLFTEKKPYVTYGGANNSWGFISGYYCGRELAEKLGK
ncbi:MAG: FAD-dependent oxidoreductase [Oscillospiraceae bacterium]|nr:FAD-dependent oxidoreductase [Oscillospiraceae bacterium]